MARLITLQERQRKRRNAQRLGVKRKNCRFWCDTNICKYIPPLNKEDTWSITTHKVENHSSFPKLRVLKQCKGARGLITLCMPQKSEVLEVFLDGVVDIT